MNKAKTIVVLLAVLVSSFMISCTKEGVYNPTKKIKKVYLSSFYYPKFLAESWNWDGNHLESIDHYDATGNLNWTENFTYEENRVTRVDNYANSCYTSYEYDGNYLKSSNFYRGDDLEISASYTYGENKLIQMVVTYNNYKKRDQPDLAYLPFPTELNEAIDRCVTKASANSIEKRTMVLTFQFTWDGDNISQIVSTSDNVVITIALQYDDKKNPLKGFHSLKSEMSDDYCPATLFSKNNITTMVISYSPTDNDARAYIYEYTISGYPTKVSELTSDNVFDYQKVTYYEY